MYSGLPHDDVSFCLVINPIGYRKVAHTIVINYNDPCSEFVHKPVKDYKQRSTRYGPLYNTSHLTVHASYFNPCELKCMYKIIFIFLLCYS